MREFARASVVDVEAHFGVSRANWDEDSAQRPDQAMVRFFLEDPSTAGCFLYHAMVDFGGAGTSEPVLFGDPGEIPRAWLDAGSIKLNFKVTPEEFASPGFLSRYFAE